MTTARQRTGRAGEDVATVYLERHGWHVLERGYRCRYGEIDLVALDGDDLVFLEVRARRGASFGTPEESITARKQQAMTACAYAWLQERGLPTGAHSWRIDLVALVLRGTAVARLDHYKHVFAP